MMKLSNILGVYVEKRFNAITNSGIAIHSYHVHKITKWLFHTLQRLERVINIAFG